MTCLEPICVWEIVVLASLQGAPTLIWQLLVKGCLIVTSNFRFWDYIKIWKITLSTNMSHNLCFMSKLCKITDLSWSPDKSPHHTPPAPCLYFHWHSCLGCSHSSPDEIRRVSSKSNFFLAPKGAYEVQMLSLYESVSLSPLCSEAHLKGPKQPPSTPQAPQS